MRIVTYIMGVCFAFLALVASCEIAMASLHGGPQ